jgi:hypothetical protein
MAAFSPIAKLWIPCRVQKRWSTDEMEDMYDLIARKGIEVIDDTAVRRRRGC